MNTILCEACGTKYPNPIQIRNSKNVTINNLRTSCPNCKYENVSNLGTEDYDNYGNVIKKYLKEANLSQSELSQLRYLLANVSIEDNTTLDELSIEAEKIKPGLSTILKLTPITTDTLLSILALIISIINLFYSPNSSTIINTTINNYNITKETFSQEFEKKQRIKNLENAKKKKFKK